MLLFIKKEVSCLAKAFKDYYQILQVHHDASPEVIKAAYRKLCTLYHPDTNGNQKEEMRMMDINEAYRILSDPDKRTEYQKVWLEKTRLRSMHVYPAAYPPQGVPYDPVKNVLDQYFHSLYIKNWDNAYSCLTLEDQQRVSKNEFSAWRKAISDCYEMQDYRIQEYRSFQRCRIGEYVYEEIKEFAVTIIDSDLQTQKNSQTTTHKYVAFDGTSWKVCLGVKNVSQATIKFKLLAERRKNYDPVALYQSAVSKNDPMTGLLSESGFYEEAFKEVERFKRHQNPLSLVAFQIDCDNPEREIACLCFCASIIKSSSRITDIIAKFGKNQIVCMLPETSETQALTATKKFITNIKNRQSEPFTVNAGVLFYTGTSAIEDAVFAVCSDASSRGHLILPNYKNQGAWL